MVFVETKFMTNGGPRNPDEPEMLAIGVHVVSLGFVLAAASELDALLAPVKVQQRDAW